MNNDKTKAISDVFKAKSADLSDIVSKKDVRDFVASIATALSTPRVKAEWVESDAHWRVLSFRPFVGIDLPNLPVYETPLCLHGLAQGQYLDVNVGDPQVYLKNPDLPLEVEMVKRLTVLDLRYANAVGLKQVASVIAKWVEDQPATSLFCQAFCKANSDAVRLANTPISEIKSQGR